MANAFDQFDADSDPFSQFDVPPKEGGALEAVLEPALAVASGAAGEVAGGLAGLASLPFGSEVAARNIGAVREFFADVGAPETEAGKEGLKTIGDLAQMGVDIVNFPISGLAGLAELATGQGVEQAAETVTDIQEEGLGETVGERVFEETGSPLLAAAGAALPEAVMSLYPASRMASKRSAFKDKIAEDIASGSGDRNLANYMVTGSGKVKADKVAKEAIRQGFDEGVISAVKGSTPVDRAKMREMTKILDKTKKDARYAMDNRPSDVAGDSLLERVRHIKGVNRKAGAELDTVAKSLRGQSADFSTPVDNFISSLDDMGVKLDSNLNPIFKGSDIEDLAGPQNAIKNVIRRMAKGERGEVPDAHDMHRMKKFIDENVTYGKTAEGLGGKTESVLKSLRRDIDEALDGQFPEYDKVNTTYSDTVNALDSLQDAAGKKMDLFGKNADKAVGTLLRRLMGNAQSRVNLSDSIDSVESVAKKYGGQFSDDIKTQMLFADELEGVFQPATRTSFKAEIGKEVQRGIEQAAQPSVIGAVAEGAGKLAEKVRGISEDAAMKAINELLER
jgi:hypothetical protein